MNQVVHTFEGLMNADGAPERVAANEFCYAENLRFNKNGRLEMIEGHRKINNPLLPAGVNTVVGVYEDDPKDRLIYLVHNSAGAHGVYVLFFDGTFLCAIAESDCAGLGFSADRYIHSCGMVGYLFYWVDAPNEPYRINIEAALKAKNAGYVTDVAPYVYPLAYSLQTVIRKPPNRPLEVAKVYDNSRPINQTKDHGFRFAYRYAYKDGERSTLSAQSGKVSPNLPGENFNSVDVSIPVDEKIPVDVQAVELIVVFISDNTFFSIKTWDAVTDGAAIAAHNAGTTALKYRFYNSNIGYAISNADKIKPFDSVPIEAGTMAIGKNRLLLGDVTLGYDTPAQTSLALQNTSTPGTGYTTIFDFTPNFFTYQTDDGHEKLMDFLPRNGSTWPNFTLSAGNSFFTYTGPNIVNAKIEVNLSVFWEKTTVIPFVLKVLKNGNVIDGFSWESTSGPATMVANGVLLNSLSLNTGDELTFLMTISVFNNEYTWNLSLSTGSTYIKILSDNDVGEAGIEVLKSGSSIKAGIVFYDRFMRQCGVCTNDGLYHTTPNRTYSGDTDFSTRTQWSLPAGAQPNEIPAWAWFYSIVISKNLRTNFFLQSRATGVKYTKKDEAGLYILDGPDGPFAQGFAGVAVKADLLFGYGLGYSYTEGDILRIHTGTLAPIDTPIKAVQGDWVIAEPVDVGGTAGANVLFEIYTPLQNNADAFFYEVGQLYPITAAATANRAFSTISGVVPPDVYLLLRKTTTAENYFVEAMNANDNNWRQWPTSHGRIQVADTVGQTKIPTGVAYSNVYIPGTNTNGLSSFEALNIEVLPLEISRLQKLQLTKKMQSEGTVLLGIGEEETVSLYLGESQIYDSDGNSFLAKSNNFIGQVVLLRGRYGTRHPESVAANGNDLVFWLDAMNGAVVQYSPAGLEAVSRYKLENFWRNWCAAYFALPNSWWATSGQRNVIVGGVDRFNGEYLLSIPAIAEAEDLQPGELATANNGQAKTMSYNIGNNGWNGAYRYKAECFAMFKNVVHSCKNGQVYAHDVEGSGCQLHEVTQNATLIFYESGPAFVHTKTWNTIAILGSHAPQEAKAQTILPYLQQTTLVNSDFKNKEGKHYASWKRNTLTPGENPLTALLTGEKMRGQSLYVTLLFEGNGTSPMAATIVFLNSVTFGIVYSKGHTV